MAEPADRHLPAQLCRVAGQHPGLVDQRRGQRVDRDPGCGEPGGQEVGQPVQSGLGRRIVRADDAAGEGGDGGDEQDPAETPVPAWRAPRTAGSITRITPI